MIWVGFIIISLYFFAIALLCIGYKMVPYFSVVGSVPETKFSIVIPFRNEAENLSALARSLQQLHYPTSHFELIFVNDASEDNSEDIIIQHLKGSSIDFQILQNTPNQLSPKKTAITKAISIAKHPWIVTTDADCEVPTHWLRILNDFILKTEPVCVAMPVDYTTNNSFLHLYQQLDNWSLQAVTVGSFGLGAMLLSNGANFAYTKDTFKSVNGFEGNLHIASGDDMFLLEKLKRRFPEKIGYLKSRNAVVTTKPVETWKQLISQRIRWASKTAKQNSAATKALGLLVFVVNILIPLSILLTIFCPQHSNAVGALLLYKFCIDFLLLWKSAQFFRKRFPFFSFLSLLGSMFVYPIVTILVVISSFWGRYVWKGRRFEKL
ncbi:glycosyltransferase [Marinirhabdus gelatinilytica]|uniref:Cellulose synthase/poly-beta-1,6-N-acetylglucosamine synthase-like glycosyltransferase n=1 Tax=Marinirhabdus gelatinilytica TaxID=1703343 RepID=A0A370QKI4_9FLAO|nr:glycosyltransferase [Marinirhabdus gelatinilytica]RDK88885.1 cellulose synthase/poly-beta-1,6-N-acetylglucosamine synthase-like glycosyltransferase [Marinirhabdus gelatinilytica]